MQQRQVPQIDRRLLMQIVKDGLLGFTAGTASYLYVWLNPITYDDVHWAALCALGGFVAACFLRRRCESS
jgi:hypothetical protein